MSISPDYKTLIDREVWAFIERTENHYPPDASTRSIDEQRLFYTQLCRDFSVAYPHGVRSSDHTIQSASNAIPVRRYTHKSNSAQAHIVYVHGGGYVLGDLESHDDVCAELCAYTGCNVTSVDYRLAPEHEHPAAFDDCLAVVKHEAQEKACPLLLCGDSAGGNLCAAVAHSLRDASTASPVAGQVLFYPELGGDKRAGSYLEHAHAPMLSLDDVDFYQRIRFDSATSCSASIDSTSAPLRDTRFSELPDTLVISAACDPLSDDAKHYVDAIKQAGGNAQWRNEEGLVHGFLRARHLSEKARCSFSFAIDTLKRFATTA